MQGRYWSTHGDENHKVNMEYSLCHAKEFGLDFEGDGKPLKYFNHMF